MDVVEVLLGVLAGAGVLVALGVVLVGGVLGALAMIGAVSFVRCERCRHVGVVAPAARLTSCMHCRHPLALHPLHTVRKHREPHAPSH